MAAVGAKRTDGWSRREAVIADRVDRGRSWGLAAVRLANVAGLNCIHSSGGPAFPPAAREGTGARVWASSFLGLTSRTGAKKSPRLSRRINSPEELADRASPTHAELIELLGGWRKASETL
jgi:hypothetical protein